VKLALLSLALAAGGGLPAAHRPTAAVDFYDGSFECYAGPLALRLPDRYPRLLSLGKLRRIVNGRAQNYRGYRTIQRTISFDGLSVIVYVFSNDPNRYVLSRLIISAHGWQQLTALRIGAPARSVLLQRDWPAAPTDGTWRMDGDSAHVTLSLAHGRITLIRYVCDMP